MAVEYSIENQKTNAQFYAAEDQTILDSALRANEWLPHSCTQGTCGTCKIRVLQGEVAHNASPEYTLTAEERDTGLALACTASACSNLVIEPVDQTDDAAPHHPLRDYHGTVVALDDIATGTRRLLIELDEPMKFNAGQYCALDIPGTPISRHYSMANPPSQDQLLEFHVRLTPGGAATAGWIFSSLQPGQKVALRGPLGQFNCFEPRQESTILVGGGTGLAPLKSIVLHALEHDLLPEIYLYHGGRTQQDLYDVEFFEGLSEKYDHFHYRPALSEEQWSGAHGLITDAVLEDFATCRGMAGYICGPPPMVTAAVKAFKRRRMSPRLIFREEFTPTGGNPLPHSTNSPS
ncbi:2Fe-2S iron-sulfur cluster-binding protein [Rhodococcus sp. NPDC057014]|uniref:2Fe-2S iron-sulfur cluster-binding protein n=1 Tax=Rhodococcus sp. NPDC057014 TaxID=3346000 RepID=UPI00362DAED9